MSDSEMRWCGTHDVPYVGVCPIEEQEKQRKSDYQRGLLDGLLEAARLSCPYCQEGAKPLLTLPRGRPFGYYHDRRVDGWIGCYSADAYRRIAAVVAEEIKEAA